MKPLSRFTMWVAFMSAPWCLSVWCTYSLPAGGGSVNSGARSEACLTYRLAVGDHVQGHRPAGLGAAGHRVRQVAGVRLAVKLDRHQPPVRGSCGGLVKLVLDVVATPPAGLPQALQEPPVEVIV